MLNSLPCANAIDQTSRSAVLLNHAQSNEPAQLPPIHPFFLQKKPLKKKSSTKLINVKSHVKNGKHVAAHSRRIAVKKSSKTSIKPPLKKINLDTRPDPKMIMLQFELNHQELLEISRNK